MLKSFILIIFLVFEASIGCFIPHPRSTSKDFLIIKKGHSKNHHSPGSQNFDDEDEGFIYKKGTESYDDACGKENASPKRIIGGLIAKPNQFPWMTFVKIDIPQTLMGWTCSASLISNQWVLTAAHCLYSSESFIVKLYLGSHNVQNESEPHRVVLKSAHHQIHPKFFIDEVPGLPGSIQSIQNDIALIKLDKSIEFNKFIQPLCLPSYTDATNSFVDKTAMAAGWGKTSDQPFSPGSDKLRFVEQLPILSVKKCQQTYEFISSGTICISSKGHKGICSGDSGGPLSFKKKDNRYMVLGTASFARSGCEFGHAQVYTRVPHKKYLRWIETVTQIKIHD